MQLTVVSMELVVVGYFVLAEMSDGTLKELSVPWGAPDEAGLRRWRWLTVDQLVEAARQHNRYRRDTCNYALHLDKVRRLGHDYAARGY